MPSLSDIPGKDLVTGTGRRAGKAAIGAGVAVIAIGGYVARRLVRRGRGEEGAVDADPIAETPTAPPGSEGNGTATEAAAENPPPPPKPPPQPKPPRPEPPKPAPPEPPKSAPPEPEPPQRDKPDD